MIFYRDGSKPTLARLAAVVPDKTTALQFHFCKLYSLALVLELVLVLSAVGQGQAQGEKIGILGSRT